MPRNLPTSILQKFCSPEWVAKCYSEYMLDCAAAQAELLGAIQELISDDDITEYVEQQLDSWTQDKQELIMSTTLYAAKLNINLDKGSPDYRDNVLTVIRHRDSSDECARMLAAKDAMDNYPMVPTDEAIYTLVFDPDAKEDWMFEYDTTYNQMVEGKINTKFQSLNINPNSVYTLDEGFTTYKDMCSKLIRASMVGDDSLSLSIKNAAGAVIENAKSFDYQSIIDQIKTAYASSAAWGCGFAAIAKTNLSDAMQSFKANIGTLVSDTSQKFANTCNTVSALISNTVGSVKDFFDQAGDMLGWNSVANDTFEKVDQTNVYGYTGASPLASINTKGVTGVLAATGKTALAVGAAVFEGAKKLLGWLWKKAKPFVMAITDDPVDIGVCDKNDDSYACSNFKAQTKQGMHLFPMDNVDPNFVNFINGVFQDKLNKWISCETYFAQFTFRITQAAAVNTGDPLNDGLRINYDIQYRPRCVNYSEAWKMGLVELINLTASWGTRPAVKYDDSDLTEWSKLLNGDIRPNDDADEKEVYMGYWLALCMQEIIGGHLFFQLNDWIYGETGLKFSLTAKYLRGSRASEGQGAQDSSLYSSYLGPTGWSYWNGGTIDRLPAHVTNLDFLRITSGWDSYYNRFDAFPAINVNSSQHTADMNGRMFLQEIMGPFLLSWVIQQYDKYNHPTEYLFLPYTSNTYQFTDGRYRIKTDAENANIANLIVQALIIIVTIVIVVVVGKSLLKVFKNKKIAKLSGKIGIMDNSMWNGHKLTTSEAMKYNRYKKKLSKIEGGSIGLPGSASATESIINHCKQLVNYTTSQNSPTVNSAMSDSDKLKLISRILGVK